MFHLTIFATLKITAGGLRNALFIDERKTFFNVRGSACQENGAAATSVPEGIGSLVAQGRSLTEAVLAGSYSCGVAG